MTLPKHFPEASRRCQALNRVGSQCRNAGTAYFPLNAHHEALLCPEHQRQARDGVSSGCRIFPPIYIYSTGSRPMPPRTLIPLPEVR